MKRLLVSRQSERLFAAIRMVQGGFQPSSGDGIAGSSAGARLDAHVAAGIEASLIELDPYVVAVAVVLLDKPEDDLPPETIVLFAEAVQRPQISGFSGEGHR